MNDRGVAPRRHAMRACRANGVRARGRERPDGQRIQAPAVAGYIADMTAQLESMATAAGLDLLAYFLAMARAESEAAAQRRLARRRQGASRLTDSPSAGAFDGARRQRGRARRDVGLVRRRRGLRRFVASIRSPSAAQRDRRRCARCVRRVRARSARRGPGARRRSAARASSSIDTGAGPSRAATARRPAVSPAVIVARPRAASPVARRPRRATGRRRYAAPPCARRNRALAAARARSARLRRARTGSRRRAAGRWSPRRADRAASRARRAPRGPARRRGAR